MEKSIRIARYARAHRNKKGFSLVEMVLVVAISSIIALAVSQIFLTAMRNFESNKEMQKNLEQGRSTMEIMAKSMRMSKYASPSGTRIIHFYNTSQNRCIKYEFNIAQKKLLGKICAPATDTDGKMIGQCEATGSCFDDANVEETTLAENVDGEFYVTPSDRTSGSLAVGRATIRMTTGVGTDLEKNIQTTVSFRDYEDILY